jgi:hypothetical protein
MYFITYVAQGITHTFARIGNAVTPPLVTWLMLAFTSRGSFIILGVASFLWAPPLGPVLPRQSA